MLRIWFISSFEGLKSKTSQLLTMWSGLLEPGIVMYLSYKHHWRIIWTSAFPWALAKSSPWLCHYQHFTTCVTGFRMDFRIPLQSHTVSHSPEVLCSCSAVPKPSEASAAWHKTSWKKAAVGMAHHCLLTALFNCAQPFVYALFLENPATFL